jgi:hypothetical protein
LLDCRRRTAMAIILKANKVNLFVSSVLFVFWYHSPNGLDSLHIYNISWLRVKCQRFRTLCLFHLHRRVGVKCDCGWESGVWYVKRLARKTAWAPPGPVLYTTLSTSVTLYTYPPMKMEQTECSETLTFKIQTPENNPKWGIQHSKHGESLKSWILYVLTVYKPTLY